MKSTVSLFATLLFVLQPYAIAQSASAPSSPAAPALSDTQTVDLTKANSSILLEHTESQPVYTTEALPDTCYNYVQQGTKQDCQTLNDHECTTADQTQCTTVNNPVCQNVPTQQCSEVPTQQCSNVNVPVCQQVPRQQCQDVPECHQVTDTVCHGDPQVCTDVPRSECTQVSQCTSVYDTVCHDESQQQCSTVDQQQCQTVEQQQCQDNYQQQCQQVPVQTCTDTPYQSCQTVPNMVPVPYACTTNQQVQTGTQITAHVLATVNVVIKNVGNVDLSGEQLTTTLSDNDVALNLTQSSQKVIFHLIKKDQQVTPTTSVESTIATTFTLEVFSIDQLNQLSQVKMTNVALHANSLNFNLPGVDVSELPVVIDNGHLKATYVQVGFLWIKSTKTLVDSDFTGGEVKTSGIQNELDFSNFRLGAIKSQVYTVNFEVALKLTLNANELLNPDLLYQVSIQPISGSFLGNPSN